MCSRHYVIRSPSPQRDVEDSDGTKDTDGFAVYCGGEIRCADYAASGTPDVGQNAVKALEGRAAALIATTASWSVAPRPDKVLHVTALVERTAQIVWGARALGGPVPIPDEINNNFASVYTYLRQNPP